MSNIQADKYLLPRLRNKSRLRIIALGDSISYGVGDFGGHESSIGPGWAGRLANDVYAEKFLNISKNGARVRDVSSMQLSAAIAARADLALICVGGNDVLRGDFCLLEIEYGLVKVCEDLQSRNIAVAIMSLPHAGRNLRIPSLVSKVFFWRVEQVNRIIKSVCDLTGSLHISIHELPQVHNREFWHSDFMHPSAFGHQVIADKVRRELSLPRKRKIRIATSNPKDSPLQRIIWLVTKGSIWVARRSVDLLPALVYLIVKESLKKPERTPSRTVMTIPAEQVDSHFSQDIKEELVEKILLNSYRASASSELGLFKNSLNERISFPACAPSINR